MRESKKQRYPRVELGEKNLTKEKRIYTEKRKKQYLAELKRFCNNDNWWEEAYFMGYCIESPADQDNVRKDKRSMKQILKASEDEKYK